MVDNHFLYSHDLNVRFRGDIVHEEKLDANHSKG